MELKVGMEECGVVIVLIFSFLDGDIYGTEGMG